VENAKDILSTDVLPGNVESSRKKTHYCIYSASFKRIFFASGTLFMLLKSVDFLLTVNARLQTLSEKTLTKSPLVEQSIMKEL
jgi:hypothetical protein